MRTICALGLVVGLAALAATPALADGAGARDIQAAVDHYLDGGAPDASLVGGPGSAGYDGGFWIRGGDFSLKINLTLQARFESWDWDNEDGADGSDRASRNQGVFGGDLSGFSLPRATLKLSGTAPCNICYYMELEFGHFGRDVAEAIFENDFNRDTRHLGDGNGNDGFDSQTMNFDNTREAWIEWCYCPAFNFRMGQIKTPNTRQSMTPPEFQQFVDVSLATSYTMAFIAGMTDRNRDHGFMVHGVMGCDDDISWMVTVTNGDGGDSVRNVLDHRTSDNLAYGARVNWAFLQPIGYQEGALRQQTCRWYGEVGVWFHYYADRVDKSHRPRGDFAIGGVDLALGYGGFSLTGAYSFLSQSNRSFDNPDRDRTQWLAQLGYHFVGTPWEIAARASGFSDDHSNPANGAYELAAAINYYICGHANKLTVDFAYVENFEGDSGLLAFYPGYHDGIGSEDGDSAIMIRFQWQLAL